MRETPQSGVSGSKSQNQTTTRSLFPCVTVGLMKDPEESKRRGPSRTVIIIIIIVLLVLILIVLLFVIYKIYKKRQQRKKYKGVSAVYKPTTQA